MTDAELRELHPPRKCWICGETISARLTELGIDQSDGWRPAAVFECVCGWRRIEPLKEPRGPL